MYRSGGIAVSKNDTGDHTCVYFHPDQQPQLRREENLLHRLQVMAVADTENQTDSQVSDATLSAPPFQCSSSVDASSSRPPISFSNLDSFMESVTPIVPARTSSEVNSSMHASKEGHDIPQYYYIGDLFEAFEECSAYGAGVPFLLCGIHPTTQYYVPSLSGMQLYIEPKNPGCPSEEVDAESEPPKPPSGSRGTLVFEYMERDPPHIRRTLADKAALLGSQFPELIKYRSSDLSPSSWMCVAWYPIYRIPMGPSQLDLEASFLTVHSLSTQPGSCSERTSTNVEGELNRSSNIHLPVIGLASYKLKGSMIGPSDPKERNLENALLEAASNFFTSLQTLPPDYRFFRNRY